MIAGFRDRYGTFPRLMVRAPGRVNLIGEHTDYSLLPVLPFAIDREVLIAIGPGDSEMEVDSLSSPAPARFTGVDDSAIQGWHRYVLAALQVIDIVPPVRILIGGDLPSAGGLSSSSALTMGLISALFLAQDVELPPRPLGDLTTTAERSMGVEGGQMDQLVIALAIEGHALRIDFDPIETRTIPLPDDLAAVVAYSGEPAPKAGAVNDLYNTRVVAARAGACLMAKAAELDPGDPPSLSRVRSIPTSEVELPAESTAAEVATLTGCEVGSITRLTLHAFPADAPLPISRVVNHILAEADRVDATEQALEQRSFDTLGHLLDQSHTSLQSFGASTTSLDRVTELMRSAGAYGARLTGAGFGGYALCVCPPAKVSSILTRLADHQFEPSFKVQAVSGASVIEL